MHFSKILSWAILAVVSAVVLVQASQYGNSGATPQRGQYGNGGARPHGSQYGTSLNHYPAAAKCQGYGCSQQATRGPYGPYHSYAVRPVVYGGYGLYTYKGYARHPPAATSRPRYPRSNGMASCRRPAAAGCRGRHCAAPPRHYPALAANRPLVTHQMRPVKALALAPVNQYRTRPTYQQAQQQHGGYREASSYGSGLKAAHGSGYYGPANNNAHQQRYHHGGQKAKHNGY